MLDFTPWDALLQRYVNDVGSVNYSAWQEESLEQLKSWLFKVESFDLPTSCPSEVQLAYWINLYNAGVIFQVLKRYPIPSIFPRFFNIPNGLSFWRFFSRRILSQGRYSLNQIEHQILRQQFQEPRIHFALVCAARGCPLLRNQAYYPDTVFEQLEADALRFIQNPQKVRYDSVTHTLYCSKILKWYGKDFLRVSPSVAEYIQGYLQTEMASADEPQLAYLDYDWSLNAQ
ncbi:DUF547 domain-containing protein [Desertifilum sp. FACHB-1129]|uniref:DUF547 domain-containing protein n=1 Tax=Desertifilum tharense IPPAS B-1220 TaxID=1781255 RepID=A0A1E5QQ08_9CYAN|nr:MULTISPECIES: DUF547 domain-containing protein [Desertifilum]MDA0212574.1 DUF547 domain-containing protein [Cyanobacteria bacterium FC1]MBD2314548.1 DUF547 domain-containing protein [Desertifilum sp. FACHB-1129]MBD2321776.1 DUF547 domain-containing protein [Desertifilum sp. FACHB-866]MBD2331903.1 DUF547 domain-containing protein [Desertifilum sp. FACHB-868]OEJ76740.1 hypothetical protein BH720_02975 [Desertifilum tharense IPPAS B-1220]